MKISVLSKDKENMVLRLTDIGSGYINALRRIMMAETPVLAIEDVELRKNSSALYDEMIAHRLGMLSIKTDLKSYNLPSECKCEGAGCAQCQVKLTMSATGPCVVTADMFKSQDPKIKPVHDKTPIVKLFEGQELEVEATAVMGLGIDHSKWNSSLIHYKEYPHVTIKKPENAKYLAEKYGQVLELKGGKLSVKEKEIPNFDLFEAIASESDGQITVDFKDDYVFYIESWGQLAPKEIVESALERFNKMLGDTKKLVKEV